MKIRKLKLGQKVVITELMIADGDKLQVGDIGIISDISDLDEPRADFPTRGLTGYWLSYHQIRKYKEPKYLELKVGDEVKIRNYKKHPELCVSPTRKYYKSMLEYIGTTHKVTSVLADGSVRLSNGWHYCTPTLKRVKETKSKEITVGSKVRVVKLVSIDSDYGIEVGHEYTITRHENDLYIINAPDGRERVMCEHQLKLVS